MAKEDARQKVLPVVAQKCDGKYLPYPDTKKAVDVNPCTSKASEVPPSGLEPEIL